MSFPTPSAKAPAVTTNNSQPKVTRVPIPGVITNERSESSCRLVRSILWLPVPENTPGGKLVAVGVAVGVEVAVDGGFGVPVETLGGFMLAGEFEELVDCDDRVDVCSGDIVF